MQNAILKPAPHCDESGQTIARIVPDPDQGFRPLAAAGEDKPLTAYWLRRLRDGDVLIVDQPAASAPVRSIEPKGAEKAADMRTAKPRAKETE
jgi:hypothetical protein